MKLMARPGPTCNDAAYYHTLVKTSSSSFLRLLLSGFTWNSFSEGRYSLELGHHRWWKCAVFPDQLFSAALQLPTKIIQRVYINRRVLTWTAFPSSAVVCGSFFFELIFFYWVNAALDFLLLLVEFRWHPLGARPISGPMIDKLSTLTPLDLLWSLSSVVASCGVRSSGGYCFFSGLFFCPSDSDFTVGCTIT